MGLSLILLVTPGCNKENTIPTARRIPPPPPPPPPSNTAPTVWVGDDLVKFPFSKIELISSFYDNEDNTASFTWTKISGPESYKIENKDLPTTLISNLVNGNYEFEFAAKDSLGLVGKDTISIHVELKPLTSKEIIFKDMFWVYDEWGAVYLTIPSFIYFAEAGRPYQVFILQKNSDWIEVDSDSYIPANNLHPGLSFYFNASDPIPTSVKVIFE